MQKKLFSKIIFIIFILIFFEVSLRRNTPPVSASEPSSLKIYVGPPSVPADNGFYKTIFVQLQDLQGQPARARGNTTVHLSSSLTSVGSVEPVITIPANQTYAAASFHSTYTPGSTTITAAATGYATVQASMTTTGPMPSKLAVYPFPPVLPADGGPYPAVIVQLQDSGGSPAKAPIGNVTVTLSCSDTIVGTVDHTVVIEAGKTYATATFATTGTPGSANITALASGYSSGFAMIETQNPGGSPTSLKVYVGPPSVLADGVPYKQVAVQLQNSAGDIQRTPSNMVVDLSSSVTTIGTVDPTITISAGRSYALANFNSTYGSGSTTITAAATNCKSSQETLITVGPIPAKLAVYCVPPSLPADDASYDAVAVQLQDSAGTPARDPSGNITVTLLSSAPEMGNVVSPLTIPYNKTYAIANFNSTYSAGSVAITALTSGYETGQGIVTTYVIDQQNLVASATAQPDTLNSNEQTYITVYVTYNGLSPALGVQIQLTSDNGGTFSAVTEQGNGYYTAVFTAPYVTQHIVCTVQATASKLLYESGRATAQVAVDPIILNASITAQPNTVNSNEQANITVHATSNSLPVSGATVTIASDSGGTFSPTIDEGDGYYTARFTAPNVSQQAVCTIEASVSKTGYNNAQASVQVTVNPLILNVSITTQPDSINSGDKTNVTAYVASNNIPVLGATVTFSSDSGGNFSATTEQGNGYYIAVFTAPNVTQQTVCTIQTTASKTGYSNSQASVQVTVNYTVQTSTLLILVTDADDNPIDGANITTTSQPPEAPQLTGLTNSSGLIRFYDVQAGPYTLHITKSGYDSEDQNVTITAGQSVSYTVALSAAPSFLPLPWLIAIIAMVIIIAVILILLIRKYHIISFTKEEEPETSPVTPEEPSPETTAEKSPSETSQPKTEETEPPSTTQDSNSETEDDTE